MAISTEQLVAYIENNRGVTAEDLASQIGASTRTVRTHVSRANEAMGDAARIERLRGSGYVLEIANEDAYRAWLNRSSADAAHVPQTPADRVRYLLNDLLMRNDWITLEDLSNILFVSRSAISSCLKTVEKVLAGYDLELEKRPHYGIRVTGDEMQKRLCLAGIVMAGCPSPTGKHGGGCPNLRQSTWWILRYRASGGPISPFEPSPSASNV